VEVPKNQTNNQDLAAAMPPGQFRMILKKQQAASSKQQARIDKQARL
jgi:hypothetical protein